MERVGVEEQDDVAHPAVQDDLLDQFVDLLLVVGVAAVESVDARQPDEFKAFQSFGFRLGHPALEGLKLALDEYERLDLGVGVVLLDHAGREVGDHRGAGLLMVLFGVGLSFLFVALLFGQTDAVEVAHVLGAFLAPVDGVAGREEIIDLDALGMGFKAEGFSRLVGLHPGFALVGVLGRSEGVHLIGDAEDAEALCVIGEDFGRYRWWCGHGYLVGSGQWSVGSDH